MILPKAEILHIARLARIALSDEEISSYQRDLGSILALVETLKDAPTGGIEALCHPLDLPARLRNDEISEVVEREKFQAIAPLTERGLYLVPRVID